MTPPMPQITITRTGLRRYLRRRTIAAKLIATAVKSAGRLMVCQELQPNQDSSRMVEEAEAIRPTEIDFSALKVCSMHGLWFFEKSGEATAR